MFPLHAVQCNFNTTIRRKFKNNLLAALPFVCDGVKESFCSCSMAKFLPDQAQHGRGFSLTLQGRELRRVKTQCKYELENNGVYAVKDFLKGERLGVNKPGCGGVTQLGVLLDKSCIG